MIKLLAITLVISIFCPTALAQQPGAKMYPGTDFPGNDLGDVRSSSPDECAARCFADGRCKAFTFNAMERNCYLKWAVSRFDGSLGAVSGVIESRPVVPPGTAGQQYGSGTYPVTAPVMVLPVGPPTRCSANGGDVCSGCSTSCPAGQQASCREGEVHGTTCWTKAVCECLGPRPAPPSVYTPGPAGGPNPNSCSQQTNGVCLGCSASCPPDQNAVCSPAIPEVFERGKCQSEAYCRCQNK